MSICDYYKFIGENICNIVCLRKVGHLSRIYEIQLELHSFSLQRERQGNVK